MRKIGFDNDKYLSMQSEHIRERIGQFGDKLYLEFGGKLFDDYHASRVLPGFAPDSKLQMLLQLADQAEMIISINAADIERNKIRHDLGITYDQDVIRLIGVYKEKGLYVSSVVITRYAGQSSADVFQKKLEAIGIKVYHHYSIDGYPNNVEKIVSDEGYGKNEYVETTRPLVIVTAPGPGSGKMATCLSQLYHENKRGVKAGYAKFETFPIWNIPLKHPVNLAYEAATADLNDVNMIDPFHLEAYGETTVNYNRDIEIYPVLAAMFEGIYGHCPYKSPTDMGVNMAGNCIVDDEACQEASKQEIIRRYYQSVNRFVRDEATKDEVYKQELIMKQAKITVDDRAVVPVANKLAEETVAKAKSDAAAIVEKAQQTANKLLDENEITAQARAYASQLKVNSQNEATERVNSAIARAEEMLSNATRQADDIVKKANAESNETLARAKKWSADIREAASNFADSVLRSADKALVASINEVRDARQKISDTYKGEKNPQ